MEVQFHSFLRSASDKMFGFTPQPLYFYAYCKAQMMGPISNLKSFGEEKINFLASAKNFSTIALS
jgi:hypothetical protein